MEFTPSRRWWNIPVLSDQGIAEWADFVHTRVFALGLLGDGGSVLLLLEFATHFCCSSGGVW